MFNCMKKQFFSKLLMAAMFVTAVGSFQSCKDYDGDISTLQQNVTALQGQREALDKALSEAQSQLTAAKAAADKAVAEAKAAAESGADANEIAKKAQAAVDELAKSAALKSEVENLKSTIAGVQDLIDGKVSKAEYDNAVANLAGQISAIDTKLLTLSNELTDVKSIAEDAAEAKIAVAALRADLESQLATLAAFKKDVEEQLAGVKEVLGEGNTIGNVIENLDAKMAAAQESIDALQGRIAQIDANTQSINDVKNSLESLQNYISNTVEKVDNVNSSITTLNVFIDTALTSLVLKPTLYYGGIEAVEAIHGVYQPLGFSIYYEDEYTPTNGHTDGTSTVAYDRTSGNAWDITYEYNAKDDLIYKYPTIDAFYHVNPKYVSVENIGDLALNTEDRHYVNTTNTRAERNSLCRQLDVCGPRIYSYEGDGLLHTYFTNNADMWHSVEQYAHTVTVVSLEANAPTADGTRTVTSDWAAVARVHQNNYAIADNDAYILHYTTYPHIYKPEDTDCGMMDTQQYTWTEQHGENTAYERDIVHVYRQAREAIVNEYTHLLKWDGTPVDLDEVIEVHADHHYYDANGQIFDFPVDLEKLGFERKYTVVNYQYPASMGININGTEESQHAHIEEGHLLKANFISNGKRDLTKEPSRSSIGREPLVMIEILDNNDVMTWNPDHMNWTKDSVANDPRPNLVAVGFIKFKIVDQTPDQILGVQIESQNSHMYASCAGDTVLTNWYEVEEQILDAIKKNGLSISKSEFESNYVLRNVNGEEYPFRELSSATGYIDGQVFVPQTNHTSICGTRQNWVAGVDLTKPANWVLPQVVLNEDRTEPGFVDPDRYGRIVYTNYDWLHRETNLIGVAFTAEEMLQQLVKRDHLGIYLDSLGNKVATLSEADFYPFVDTKVAAKLVDPNHNGWPEVTLTFNVRVHLNKATMNRPAKEGTGWGGWYKVGGSELKYVNANIDAFWNGATNATAVPYSYDVRRFILNLQQELKGQQWLASSSSYTRAFDFFYNEITGTRAAERIGIQRAKLGELHGDLYFFTKNWLGDLEEGTPYWHDANNTPTVADDKFYADKYLIKVCYTKNPLDTVVWAQEAMGSRHIGKLGKYLFAYKYIEDWKNAEKYDAVPKNTDPLNPAQALEQNYSHYDMAHGELIAWIDNYDTHQVAANPNQPIKYANFDINGRLNENVNVHLNYNSRYAQDLLNRAGRYAEKNAGTLDGYSKEGDNPFSVNVHLNLFEGDCVLAVNPSATEVKAGQDFLFRNDYTENYLLTGGSVAHRADATEYVPAGNWTMPASYEYHTFFHRPAGVPVMLSNPDFIIRFERPISVEFKTPWQNASINAVDDAIAGAAVATITYKDLFRDQSGSPYSRIFPMDWRNYTQVKNQTEWIQFYQGKNTGNWNTWNDHSNTRPYGMNGLMGFKYMDPDRSSYDRGSNLKFFNWNNGWYYLPNTSDTYADTWNSMNVVPQVDHMLVNFGGDEGFYSDNASQINLQITHTTDPATGNIVSTTFKYLNDNYNRGTFDIVIPVTVKYAWGDITTTGRWQSTTNLQRTKDNYYHNDNMNYVKVHFGATIGN